MKTRAKEPWSGRRSGRRRHRRGERRPQKTGGLENVLEEIGLNVFNRLHRYWMGQFGMGLGRVGLKLGNDLDNPTTR
jgi:hypothetical protein